MCQVVLPQPANCPKEIFDLMVECWNSDETMRPTFREIHMFLSRKNMGYDPREEVPMVKTSYLEWKRHCVMLVNTASMMNWRTRTIYSGKYVHNEQLGRFGVYCIGLNSSWQVLEFPTVPCQICEQSTVHSEQLTPVLDFLRTVPSVKDLLLTLLVYREDIHA